MAKVMVIADDLSGANDAGVQFAGQGIPTVVVASPGSSDLMSGLARRFEVVVLNSETRHVRPEQAGSRIRAWLEEGRSGGILHFYKKTDSTLRGNLGSELEAFSVAAPGGMLPFIPAFPKLGRTTRNGVQYVEGIPLAQTVYARDPCNPMVESRVEAILGRQTRLPVKTVALSDLGHLETVLPSEGIVVFDAESERDVGKIVAGLGRLGLLSAIASPAGLAGHLAAVLDCRNEVGDAPEISGPLLLVNGSLNAISLAQMQMASEAGFTRHIVTQPMLASRTKAFIRPARDLIDRVVSCLDAKRDALVQSVTKSHEISAYRDAAERQGLRGKVFHRQAADGLGRIVSEIVLRCPRATLMVSGGDTLLGITQALQVPYLLPVRELQPGLSLCRIQEPFSCLLISKPGGYGDEGLFPRLKTLLGRRQRNA